MADGGGAGGDAQEARQALESVTDHVGPPNPLPPHIPSHPSPPPPSPARWPLPPSLWSHAVLPRGGGEADKPVGGWGSRSRAGRGEGAGREPGEGGSSGALGLGQGGEGGSAPEVRACAPHVARPPCNSLLPPPSPPPSTPLPPPPLVPARVDSCTRVCAAHLEPSPDGGRGPAVRSAGIRSWLRSSSRSRTWRCSWKSSNWMKRPPSSCCGNKRAASKRPCGTAWRADAG